MAKLSTSQRAALPKSDFAVPSKAPGPGSFPMPDAAHARNALARAAQDGSPPVQAAVGAKVAAKFPGVQTDQNKPKTGAMPKGHGGKTITSADLARGHTKHGPATH